MFFDFDPASMFFDFDPAENQSFLIGVNFNPEK